MALLSALLGMGLSIVGLGDLVGLGIYYLVSSLIMLAFGGFTLYTYLRDSHPPTGNSSLNPTISEENKA